MAISLLNNAAFFHELGENKVAPSATAQPTGNRIVSLTTIFGAVALLVLLSNTAVNSMIDEKHVQLGELHYQISEEENRIRALMIQHEKATAPTKIEFWAHDHKGMIPAKSTAQIRVTAQHLSIGQRNGEDLMRRAEVSRRRQVDGRIAEALAFVGLNER